jgi:nitrile hydratase beta subunit-like protein
VIAVDAQGAGAPPRRNGELVFEAPWQARAFGMAVLLLERNGLGWEAFRRHLVRAIGERPDEPYYHQFVDALAALVDEIGDDGPDA